MRRILITGPEPVQILDVSGPLEVFSNAPDYRVELVSSTSEPVLQTHRGVPLGNAVPFRDVVAAADTLVVVGGPGAENGPCDPDYLSWVREFAPRCRRVAAICTGAFVLAEAGLLDGCDAVTHWRFCDRLAREYPAVRVQTNPIYVKDGAVYTSAGVSAGIDLCLALVEEDHGHAAALDVARFLVMFLVRPGGQAQYSHMLSRQATLSQPLHELQIWMLEHLREDLSVERLAERVGMSARHFTRVCIQETGMPPGRFVDRMRVEAAQQMLDSARGLKEIADACGFASADTMRRAFLRILGVSAGDYAARFRSRADSTSRRV